MINLPNFINRDKIHQYGRGRTKMLTAHEAAEFLGVAKITLRRWEKRSILSPVRTAGGHRRYGKEQLTEFKNKNKSAGVSFMKPNIMGVINHAPTKNTKKQIGRAFVGSFLAALILTSLGVWVRRDTHLQNGAVLADLSKLQNYILEVNVPSNFNELAEFAKDVNVDGDVTVDGNIYGNFVGEFSGSLFALGADNTTEQIESGNTLTLAGGEGIDTNISESTVIISGEDASTDNKGIAKFKDDFFSVSSGEVTIDDIYLRNNGDTGSGDYTISGKLVVDSLTLDGTTLSSSGNLNLSATTNLYFSDANISDIPLTVSDTSINAALGQGIIDAINDVYDALSGGGGGVWSLSSGVIYPTDDTHDLAIGGSSAATATFFVDAGTGAMTTASSTLVANLNADLLDSLSSADFLRSNTNDEFESGNTLTLAGALDVNGNLSIADTDIALDGASTNLTATGNFSINTDDLFIEKATGEVGIGTTDPGGYRLNVVGDVTTSTDYHIGSIGLADTGSPTTSGAFLIGANDEFDNSTSTNVQAVLNDLDAAITTAAANDGDITSVTAGSGLTGGGTDGDVTLDFASTELTDLTWGSGTGFTWTFNTGTVDPTIAFGNGSINFDSNTLYLDVANNEVGIGTNSPSAYLHILGTTEQLRLAYDSDTYAGFTVNATGELTLGINGTDALTLSSSKVTSHLPTEFLSSGDVSIAYDIDFTNATASNLTSISPLSIIAGESFNSSDLTLRTYNNGQLVVDAAGGSLFRVDGGTVSEFNRLTDDGTIVSLQQDGTEEGTISVSGTTVSYNAFTGSHYTWTDEPIERGRLVRMTGNNRRLHDNEQSEILYGVSETDSANDAAVLGAYLSPLNPSDEINHDNPHLVMAVGNGEMWIVDNGEILSPGDYLISSDTKGHAMKDTGEYEVSNVVARVAEPVDWDTVSETVDGKKHKLVSVFFENFSKTNTLAYAYSAVLPLPSPSMVEGETGGVTVTDLSVAGDAALGDVTITGSLTIGKIFIDNEKTSIDSLTTLEIQPMALSKILFEGGKVEIDTKGNVYIFEGGIYGNEYFRDTATLPAGETSVRVTRDWKEAPKTINVTPDYKTQIWVTDKNEGGFTINVDPMPLEDAHIDWMAIF